MKGRQHEAIRVPQGWTGQDKALIIQLENIFNELYRICDRLGVDIDDLGAAKADKVASATDGHFASLDENGNLEDSGHEHDDYVTEVSFDATTNKIIRIKAGTSSDIATVATLDGNGKVPSSQLPSYVDDVEEYADRAHFPTTGETDKIYVAVDTGFTYRWSGTQYVRLNTYDPAIEESGPKLDDRMIMKLFSGGTELSKGSGAYAANYALRTTPENELDLTFSMDSTQGVTNTFEIYVNGVYITKFTAQKASVKIPCSALTEGLNVITAVRIREGVYYGTCNYITLDADLYLKRVEPAEYKLTPKTLEYGEKVELVALGSEWRYYVTTRDRYDRMNGRGWMNVGYNDSTWDSHSAPLGDRLTSAASEIGWTGNNHTLFVRQTFDFDKSQLKENSSFFFNIYYDNTIYVYLNGNLIYSDDTAVTGKNDWTDSYVTIKLDDISEYLVNGKNLIAVSINDSAGGRELDLSLYAMSYTDSGYKNPTANEKPENTKLGENGGALYITARNNADNPDKTEMLTLISLPESDYDGEGVLEISFKGQSWNTTYTEKLSRLGDYGRVISDGDVFVPADGTLLLGYVIKGIPDKWQTLTVKVTSGGGTLLLSECGRTEINEKCGIK